jgi:hypothetical protein
VGRGPWAVGRGTPASPDPHLFLRFLSHLLGTVSVMDTTTISPIEAWLASLDLDAVEVDRCPVADCEVCGPLPVATAA